MEDKPMVYDRIRLEQDDLETVLRDWCSEFCQHLYRGDDDSEDGGLQGYVVTLSDLDDLAKYLAPRVRR